MSTPANPLDRPLAWTEFPDQWAKSKTQHLLSFRELAKRIQRTRGLTKNDLPWLKLAEFGDVPKSGVAGCLRHNANLLVINGIELDYDDGDLTWDQAWARLYEAGLPALLYTTRRHTSEKPRFRVLLPTSRPLPPAERAPLVARAYGVLKGTLDGASFTVSQSFYYGSTGGRSVFVEMPDPPGGRYIDLALDLDAGALDKNGEPWGAKAIEVGDDANDALATEPDFERIRAALRSIPATRWDNDYDEWLAVGQSVHHECDGSAEGLALWNEASQQCTTYNETELEAKWETFGSYGARPRTIATLYRLAAQFGKQESSSGDLRLYTPEDCEHLPPIEHLVDGVLAPRQVACVFGAPGSGKSALAPYLAWCVAQGESFFSKDTEQGTVFYVSPEDDFGMARRITALRRRYGDAPGFYRVSPDGGPWSDFFVEGSKHISQLRELIDAHRPALVVIDTLASGFNSLDENDGLQMKRAVRIARSLTVHGATVVLVHHSQKGDGAKTPRGSGVLDGDMDMTIHVTRSEGGIVRGKLKKNRIGGLDAAEIVFRIAGEPVGSNAKGQAMTAAVLEELTSNGPAEHGVPPVQMRLLALLDELAGDDGLASRAAMRKVAIGTERISSSDKPEYRKRTFNDGMAGLLRIGMIGTDGDKTFRTQLDVIDNHEDHD